MIVTRIEIGPEDQGRIMSLEDFAHAEGRAGHGYELARGRVVVVEVPRVPHALVVQAVHRQLRAYDLAHQGRIYLLAGGSDCALRLPGMQSERHPDAAVYLTSPPAGDDPWSRWIPEIAVEVVSPGAEARQRDYVVKREEYLAAGIREYWIVDPEMRSVVALVRDGDRWQEQRRGAGDRHRTGVLPGFELDVAGLFA